MRVDRDMRSRRVTWIAIATALAFPAVAGADVSDTSSGLQVTGLSAEKGKLVSVAKRGTFGTERLYEGFGPDMKPLGAPEVAPRRARFIGLSLGTDARRHLVAVYTYCVRTGCRVFGYNFETGHHRPLFTPNRDCFPSSPEMDRGVLYFAEPPRDGSQCTVGIFQKRPGRRVRRLTRRGPQDFDVSGGLLALKFTPSVNPVERTEIRLMRIGRRKSRLVATARYDQDTRGAVLFGVELDEGFVYWGRLTQRLERGSREVANSIDLMRAPVRGEPVQETLSAEGRMLPPGAEPGGGLPGNLYAVDGENIFYSYLPGGPPTRVTPAPRFVP